MDVPHSFYLRTCLSSQLAQIWLSNLSILSLPDEGYSRNASCPLNYIYIPTFLFQHYFVTVARLREKNVLSHQLYCSCGNAKNCCSKLIQSMKDMLPAFLSHVLFIT